MKPRGPFSEHGMHDDVIDTNSEVRTWVLDILL